MYKVRAFKTVSIQNKFDVTKTYYSFGYKYLLQFIILAEISTITKEDFVIY